LEKKGRGRLGERGEVGSEKAISRANFRGKSGTRGDSKPAEASILCKKIRNKRAKAGEETGSSRRARVKADFSRRAKE